MQSSGKHGGGFGPGLPPEQPPDQNQVAPVRPYVDHPMDHLAPDNEPDVKLDESAQALIGHHLKTVYSEIVAQPIPDQLLALLDELERKERER